MREYIVLLLFSMICMVAGGLIFDTLTDLVQDGLNMTINRIVFVTLLLCMIGVLIICLGSSIQFAD